MCLIKMYCFLLAFASLTLTSFGYVFVKMVDSDGPKYDGYRVRTVIDQDRSEVLIADSPTSTLGEQSILSFESGAMLLNGRLVRIKFAQRQNLDNSHFRLHIPRQKMPRDMFTSGYELGMSEQTFDPGVSQFVTARPILYYSQNIHHLCTTHSDQQQEDSISISRLLLFPYIFAREGCTQVRLMQITDPSNSPWGQYGFTPTDRRGWPMAQPNPLPSIIDSGEMFFRVVYLPEETWAHGPMIVSVIKDRALGISQATPIPEDPPFLASIIQGKLVASRWPHQSVSVRLTNHGNSLHLPDDESFLLRYNFNKMYKALDGFHVEFDGISGKRFLAISGQSVWQECSMRIVHIAGGSDLECSDIRIEALPTQEWTRLFETQPTPVEHHNDVSNEILNEQDAVDTLANVINRSELTYIEGGLYIRCMMQAAAEAFPCDNGIVTVPLPSGQLLRQVDYLSVSPVRARNDQRVLVTVSNGIQKFIVHRPGYTDQDFDLFTDRGFLWLGNRGQSTTAQFRHWSLHSLKHNLPEIPNIRSSDRILKIDNRSTFYLCREVTRNTVMYFILPKPRRNSSLCTFVLLYMRPDNDQDASTSKFHHRETSLMASHRQPTLVDANLSGNPRYGPDNRMFSGPSNEPVAFGIPDSSHHFMLIHPNRNHPENPSDHGNNFPAYSGSGYTVDTGFAPGQHSTVVSNVDQHEDLRYPHGWSETRSPDTDSK